MKPGGLVPGNGSERLVSASRRQVTVLAVAKQENAMPLYDCAITAPLPFICRGLCPSPPLTSTLCPLLP